MSKLSDLLRYHQHLKNRLLAWEDQSFSHHTQGLVHDCLHGHVLEHIDHSIQQAQARVSVSSRALEASIVDLKQCLAGLSSEIQQVIQNSRSDLITQSQRLYHNQLNDYSLASVWSRTVPCDSAQREMLLNKITAQSKLLEIGMIIRPMQESWITAMFGMDMIYVFDNHMALLDPALNSVPEHLRGKLRDYVGTDQNPFATMPLQQISLIFAWNFFNYKPLPVLAHYLWEFTRLLRPGGSVLITFNDCDQAVNTGFSESNFMCFTPGSMVIDRCQQLGYDIQDHYTADNGLSWLELRWPGRWDNIRGAPVITKIHARSK